jgi:hypothetical protein
MQRPHLVFSLENYPDDGRIGPHIIAANFQAFLVVDLILGFLHYRMQLEPFSTVVHHIIYYFIVVHMRAGDMLSVFCILGTPIEGRVIISFCVVCVWHWALGNDSWQLAIGNWHLAFGIWASGPLSLWYLAFWNTRMNGLLCPFCPFSFPFLQWLSILPLLNACVNVSPRGLFL